MTARFFFIPMVCLVVGGLLFEHTPVAAQEKSWAGLVVAVEGDVSIVRGNQTKPATEGFVLEPGDTIFVKIGGTCSGFGPSGSRFDVTGPAQLVLEVASHKGTLDKIRAFIARQLAQWSGASRSQSLVSRGIRDWTRVIQSPSTLLPASDGVVRASQSRFYWTLASGVGTYLVTIAPEKGEEIKRTIRGHSMATEGLDPRKNYAWKVESQDGGNHSSSPWSAFRVMRPDDEKQLDEALVGLSDLEAGVLLLSLGLHEEAIYRLDAAVMSGSQHRSSLRWRARALAAIGLDKDAYVDLLQTTEW